LNSLAAYNIKEGAKEKEKSKKDEFSENAIRLFNKADSIDQMFEMTWVGKGVSHLLVGELNRGKVWFDNALENNSENLPAILGKVSSLSLLCRTVVLVTLKLCFILAKGLHFFQEWKLP
jgi:hypothetical protein